MADRLLHLSSDQAALVAQPVAGPVFLEGPAGAGKTTAGLARLRRLVDEGVPPESILVLLPQRTLAGPYVESLPAPVWGLAPNAGLPGRVTVSTLAGLARRAVERFWRAIAVPAGFSHPKEPPIFLNLETAQFFMAQVAAPLLAAGYFDAVRIEPPRLFSQILNNLNRSAVVGFPLERSARASRLPGLATLHRRAPSTTSRTAPIASASSASSTTWSITPC